MHVVLIIFCCCDSSYSTSPQPRNLHSIAHQHRLKNPILFQQLPGEYRQIPYCKWTLSEAISLLVPPRFILGKYTAEKTDSVRDGCGFMTWRRELVFCFLTGRLDQGRPCCRMCSPLMLPSSSPHPNLILQRELSFPPPPPTPPPYLHLTPPPPPNPRHTPWSTKAGLLDKYRSTH